MTSTVHRTCPLCEAVCGLTLTLVDDGRVTRVRGDKEDPFSKGFICPKGASLGRLDEDPDRLREPLIREGSRWREATWDEAFAAVERGLAPRRRPNRPSGAGRTGWGGGRAGCAACPRRTASCPWPRSPTRSRRRARGRSGSWSRWRATRCCRPRTATAW